MSQLGSFATYVKRKEVNANLKQSSVQRDCFLQRFFLNFFSYTHLRSKSYLLEKITASLKHCFKNAKQQNSFYLLCISSLWATFFIVINHYLYSGLKKTPFCIKKFLPILLLLLFLFFHISG